MTTTCPKCGWSNTRLSIPTGVDVVLRAFLLSPVRCRQCRLRFYRFSLRGFSKAAGAQVAPEPIVPATLPEQLPEPVAPILTSEPSLSSRTSGARRALEIAKPRQGYELMSSYRKMLERRIVA